MQTPSMEVRAEPARILDPLQRSSEVLFGLIMVLTFTGSLSVATSSREDVRAMFLGALGCNLAWGVVDAVMYLSGLLVERGRMLTLGRAVRASTDPAATRAYVEHALPEGFGRIVDPAQLDAMAVRIRMLPEPPRFPRLHPRDFAGALSVLLLVFVSTLPVVLPFLFIQETWRAMRWSNGIAIGMLFWTGYLQAGWGGLRRLPFAMAMVALGILLVALTIALGG
ncbi:MAG: VIT1/CCC1 transporter family protein [Planctomycetota bacterium]|nr:VIT1/CCC1 transporter family protein [Planctomycetota bacterium]